METLAKSDIFFVLTGVAVIVLTIGILAILYYVLRILRNVLSISETVKGEAGAITETVSRMRKAIVKKILPSRKKD